MPSDDCRFIEIEGARLETRTRPATRDGGPAVIFLHEGLGSTSTWRDFPDRVAHATGLRVIAYSRRGYGHSDPAPRPRPLSFMHEEARGDLPALLDALDARDSILVGHSDGASIALLYAADRPAGLRGVVAIAPHVRVEDVTVESIAKLPAAYRDQGLRERLARHHGASVDDTFRGWTDVWLDPDFPGWNIEAEVADIRVPILVIQGTDDEYGTVAQVASIEARATAHVEVMILDACGHSPQRSRPDKTLEVIRAFVDRFA